MTGGPFTFPTPFEGVFVERTDGERYPVVSINRNVVFFRLPDGSTDERGFDDDGRFYDLRIVRAGHHAAPGRTDG